MIVSEVYNLWAIESSDEKVKRILSFAEVNDGVVIAPNINKFRELKLRLLNGSHTFGCGLAHLSGFATVKEAMDDEDFSNYMIGLMQDEIVPMICRESIHINEANDFTKKVSDRYRNNFIEHKWLSITAQYSSKMNMRNGAVVKGFVERHGYLPPHMALGLAAHILFMRSVLSEDGNYYGEINGTSYLVNDQHAALYAAAWKGGDTEDAVIKILSNENLWQQDLTALPVIKKEVIHWLQILINEGAIAAMQKAGRQKKELINEK
jgi:tagaturonate reductase